MWAISREKSCHRIAYFERIGLGGLPPNSHYRVGYWEWEKGVAYWCMPLLYFLFPHSLFFLSLSLFFWFLCYLSSFLSFFLLLFFLTLSYLFLSVISCVCPPPPTMHSQGIFILPIMMGFTMLPLNYFCPGMGVLPKPPTGLSATQPSPLPCTGCAMFHSQIKEWCFVFLLSVAFPSE